MTIKSFKSKFLRLTEEQKRQVLNNMENVVKNKVLSNGKPVTDKQLEQTNILINWCKLRVKPNESELLDFLGMI